MSEQLTDDQSNDTFLPQDAGNESNLEPQEQANDKDEKGWKTLDEYVEGGGDPDMFRGKKAFDQYHEFKTKERGKTDQANEQLTLLVEMQKQQIEEATNKARTDERTRLQSEMETAKTDLDFDRYEQASKELNTHDQQQQAPKENAPHPEWTSTLKDLPMLDQSGENYNSAFFNVFQGNLNDELVKIGKKPEQLSDIEVRYAMSLARDKSKTDMPHLFREQRKAAPTATPGGKAIKGDLRGRLDEGAKGMYDRFVKMGKKETAVQFAKNQLGE